MQLCSVSKPHFVQVHVGHSDLGTGFGSISQPCSFGSDEKNAAAYGGTFPDTKRGWTWTPTVSQSSLGGAMQHGLTDGLLLVSAVREWIKIGAMIV